MIFLIGISIILLLLLISAYAIGAWTSLLISKQSLFDSSSQLSPSQKKLTVFLVTNNYTPFSGGVVSAIDSYAQELRALGHRAIIITLNFTGSQPPEEDVIRLWCPIRFGYRNNYMAIPWRATRQLYELAQRYKPDIIHTYHPFLLGASALKVGRKLKIPVIFSYLTLYDQYCHYVPLPACITQPVTRCIVNNFCKKVDALIVPGQSIKKYIQAQGVTRNIEVIPLSILPIFLHNTYTAKKRSSQSRHILICVSRFAPEKNLYFLLDMFKHLAPNRYTLVLVGFGILEDELKKYAYETLKLTNEDIIFIIKPSKQELCDWYNKAELFVFASHSETQGLVLAEAMANGTPVIALEAPGIQDIVVNGENGYMVHTQQEMASTIDSILDSPDLYAQLSPHAWRTAQNYCPKKRALSILKVYAALTEN